MSMIAEYVRLYDSEEDPARKGNHEAALRKAISEDVTVGGKIIGLQAPTCLRCV